MKLSLHEYLPVLVVDDEIPVLKNTSFLLKTHGISNVITCDDSRKVQEILANEEIGVMLLDLSMPHVTGEEILKTASEDYPDLPVIVVTGMNSIDTAVNCMQLGAFDYMVKPVEQSRLVSGVMRALELRELIAENHRLSNKIKHAQLVNPEVFSNIITGNAEMISILCYIETIKQSRKPVLITGETGTGKELIAQSFQLMYGADCPFVIVNVAGLDDHMFSDTLFGHQKGAFTGATEARSGLIEKAQNGIIFLDEIGDLDHSSQVKLLRLLQEGSYYPLGSDIPKKSNARIIAATNRDLETLQKKGEFRKDLYYRLYTHHVNIPPLRERQDDIILLVNHFLTKASEELGKKTPTPPKELVHLLSTYSFPGNIRELEAMTFEAVSNHKSGILSLGVFKDRLKKSTSPDTVSPVVASSADVPFNLFPHKFPSIKESTQFLVNEAMKRSGNNQSIAAQLLGLTQQALSKRLKRNNVS